MPDVIKSLLKISSVGRELDEDELSDDEYSELLEKFGGEVEKLDAKLKEVSDDDPEIISIMNELKSAVKELKEEELAK